MSETHRFHNNDYLNRIIHWDFTNLMKIYNINNNLTLPIRIFSFLGSFPAYWAVFIVSFFYIDEDYALMMLTAGGLIATVILTLPKIIVKRKRPYMDERFKDFFNVDIKNRDPEFGNQQQSFPSGHVFFWMFQSIIIPYQFGGWFLVPMLLLLPVMMIARMHLGCHFPSDVIIGAVLGLVSGILTILLYDTIFIPLYSEIWGVMKNIYMLVASL